MIRSNATFTGSPLFLTTFTLLIIHMKFLSRVALSNVLPVYFVLLTGNLMAQQLQTPVGVSANSNTLVSRAPDSRAWTDPALNHNKLLQQQTSDGAYKLIGTYKVIGSSFLFGERHKGDVFSATEKAWNIFISYNTYNQELEFYSTANPNEPLVKEPGTLDSFIIQADNALGITTPLKFVYSSVIGGSDKYYYQEVTVGKRFSIYKRYKSELGFASGNYAQPELRQFDLTYEYFYTDSENKGIKKLKKNAASIIKEFKAVKDLSTIMTDEAYSQNPEEALRKAALYLNN